MGLGVESLRFQVLAEPATARPPYDEYVDQWDGEQQSLVVPRWREASPYRRLPRQAARFQRQRRRSTSQASRSRLAYHSSRIAAFAYNLPVLA